MQQILQLTFLHCCLLFIVRNRASFTFLILQIAGLFTACVFSGALSTLSSGFNSLAAITWDDLLKSRFGHISGKATSNLTKIISASYGIISLALAFVVGNLGTVLQGEYRSPLRIVH